MTITIAVERLPKLTDKTITEQHAFSRNVFPGPLPREAVSRSLGCGWQCVFGSNSKGDLDAVKSLGYKAEGDGTLFFLEYNGRISNRRGHDQICVLAVQRMASTTWEDWEDEQEVRFR